MALKPDREELVTDISHYMDETAERGGAVTLLTAGSGGGWKTVMGETHNVVTYAAAASGKVPVGVLLNDMVPKEYHGRTRREGQRDEMPVGGPCTLLRRGWVVTNKIAGTPVGGDSAYVGPSGLITPTAGGAKIGVFMGSKDEDGYARVNVLL